MRLKCWAFETGEYETVEGGDNHLAAAGMRTLLRRRRS
jgi:hypothetical protein